MRLNKQVTTYGLLAAGVSAGMLVNETSMSTLSDFTLPAVIGHIEASKAGSVG